MSTGVSLIYLERTRHLLAAITRAAANSAELDDRQLRSLIPEKGLAVRHIKQSRLEPDGGNPATDKPEGRAKTTFVFAADQFASQAGNFERASQADFLTRPTEFSVVDGQAVGTPISLPGLESLEIGIERTQVTCAFDFESDTVITAPIQAGCVLRTEETTTIRHAEFRPNPDPTKRTVGQIGFPNIPDGTHDFLFLIDGFQPIWDRLKVGTTRVWTPPTT